LGGLSLEATFHHPSEGELTQDLLERCILGERLDELEGVLLRGECGRDEAIIPVAPSSQGRPLPVTFAAWTPAVLPCVRSGILLAQPLQRPCMEETIR